MGCCSLSASLTASFTSAFGSFFFVSGSDKSRGFAKGSFFLSSAEVSCLSEDTDLVILST
ncbi:MAG TPA: hypothetical protein DEP00_07175 [Lachnospiraceae bacterium]|nr:hypothetical protein [Lachnospiraceae bacterium]